MISCPACRESWCYCKTCKKRFQSNNQSSHPQTKRHKTLHQTAYPPQAAATAEAPAADIPGDFPGPAVADSESVAAMGRDEFVEAMDQELSTTYIANADSTMDAVHQGMESEQSYSVFPKIPMEGNEWLQETMKDTSLATVAEMHAAFHGEELESMKNFWLAELGSGEGRCGGGLMYLAARAFQQVKDAQLDKKRFPDFGEAKWHFDSMIQYHSMTEKQRVRQSRLIKIIMDHVKQHNAGSFFKETYVPLYNQLGRYYGTTGQHSLWTNLPTPKAQNIDGVAYISPKAAIAFLIANGIPIDDIVIRQGQPPINETNNSRVVNVEDSRKAVNWINTIVNDYYGSNPGAPESDVGAPKRPAVIGAFFVDWKDGFGPNRTKNNRGSVDVKTLTISPPKALINGTENTFAVALGLKKAKGWAKVEHLFLKDLQELTSTTEPQLFYHGTLQKIIPVFCKRFASIADKMERPIVSGTIGFSSDAHRCFGIAGKIQTPRCKVEEVKAYFANQRLGLQSGGWGWSDQFISRDGEPNGAKFAACRHCRRRGLLKLGLTFQVADDSDDGCGLCTYWDLLKRDNNMSLDFKQHKDWPTRITEGSPVPPPAGRDVFKPGGTIPFVNITWALMMQGCKFAFFQASRRTHYWSKKATSVYLRYCGVNPKLGEALHDVARLCAKRREQDEVGYDSPNGIGSFGFPAAWLSDISILDFIETVMHMLNLGLAESNFDLATKYLSELPAAAGLGSIPFRRAIQVLLLDLKPFMLNWLQAYPFTGEKGQYKTGAWVGENWMTFVRLSKILYGWCVRDRETASKFGVDDLSRLVISFNAFVARCLTHSGIDDAFIAEVELYMKEFLSCVREFDVRVRYKDLNKNVTKVSERKKTEAWWLKPNYMSLCNLVSMMLLLGPLVLWWDGGGKGERFIQTVKPHIKRGVREDVLSFFVRLLEKVYKCRQIDLFEKRYGLSVGNDDNDDNQAADESGATVLDVLNEIAEAMILEDDDEGEGNSSYDDSNDGENSTSSSNSGDEEDGSDELDDAHFSTPEEVGMTKKKTIYIYRNEKHLNEAIANYKPLAGIVEVKTQSTTGETAFEFQTVFRKPVKQFARRKVHFNDTDGISFNGMWYSRIEVEPTPSIEPTKQFSDIQYAAKFAAVAIPLWYVIGKDKPDSYKYCVITNWWKERMSDGSYRLPTLDASLYDADIELEEFLAAAAAPNTAPAAVPTNNTNTNTTNTDNNETMLTGEI